MGLFIACFAALSIAAGPTEVDGTPVDERVYRSFEANWRKYGRYAAEADGLYVYIPNYDRRLDSSRLITPSQAMRQLTIETEQQNGNLVTRRSKSPPREEGEAYARVLPDPKVGSYGWVASAEVVEVLDDRQMLVRALHLVDRDALREQYTEDEARSARRNGGEPDHAELRWEYAERIKMMEQQEDREQGFTATFRLVGYDTRGLRRGDRWEGPNSEGFQVGVVQWETPEPAEDHDNGRRSRRDSDEPRLVLTELERTMRTTVDIEGFKRLLAERGMTVAGFVDLMRTLRERDRANAEERILNALLSEDRIE